ncbi:hypothetical protein D3C73_1560000 [compost metagenome]
MVLIRNEDKRRYVNFFQKADSVRLGSDSEFGRDPAKVVRISNIAENFIPGFFIAQGRKIIPPEWACDERFNGLLPSP